MSELVQGVDGVEAVGFVVGGAMSLGAGFAFVKWLIDRLFARADKHHERLTEREKRIAAAEKAEREDLKIRLKKLEVQVKVISADNERLRLASFMMATELHKLEPENPTLLHMASILGGAIPFPGSDPDPAMADLLDQLNEGK